MFPRPVLRDYAIAASVAAALAASGAGARVLQKGLVWAWKADTSPTRRSERSRGDAPIRGGAALAGRGARLAQTSQPPVATTAGAIAERSWSLSPRPGRQSLVRAEFAGKASERKPSSTLACHAGPK